MISLKNSILEKFFNGNKIDNNIYYIEKSEIYTSNFGLQWNEFSKTQIDNFSGIDDTESRLNNHLPCKISDLKNKFILELGSGAGRFTSIFLKAGAKVISVEPSDAIIANFKINNSPNLLCLKARIDQLKIFNKCSFFLVFCFGVIQHTPDPELTIKQIASISKNSSHVSLDVYRKFLLSPWSNPKYIWRPITTRISPATLLCIIRWYIPKWINIDTFIRKIPKIGPLILSLIPIPCWNYLDKSLSKKQRLEWAILDTFDALGAKYDKPFWKKDFEKYCKKYFDSYFENINVYYGSNGVVAKIKRK